MTDTKTKSSEK